MQALDVHKLVREKEMDKRQKQSKKFPLLFLKRSVHDRSQPAATTTKKFSFATVGQRPKVNELCVLFSFFFSLVFSSLSVLLFPQKYSAV